MSINVTNKKKTYYIFIKKKMLSINKKAEGLCEICVLWKN